jgi:hypothetical protein
LSSLLNEDSGVLDERNTKSEWAERAFDTMPGDKWIVLKVPQGNRGHVLCDFCDGDDLDDKKWMEGPFSQSLTLRELIEYQAGSNRERRRACTDNLLSKAHSRKSKELCVEDHRPDVGESSSGKAPNRSVEGARDERREEILQRQRAELQHYNDMKEEGSFKPSRKALRHARRNTDKTVKEGEDSTERKKRGPPEWVQSAGNQGMPSKQANPLEGKNKRMKNETRMDPGQPPARGVANSEQARSNEPSAPMVVPTVEAWPVLRPAGARKRRNKMSRRQREGLNPSCPRARERLVESNHERGQNGGVRRPAYIPRQDRPRTPKWKVGDNIKYYDARNRFSEGWGKIIAVIQPGIEGYSPDDGEYRYEIDTIYSVNQSSTGWVLEQHIKPVVKRSALPATDGARGNALHPLDHIGIDTCSALSVSTESGDFLCLDKSEAAVRSVSLGGIGGNESKVGGRGPLLIKTMDANGKMVFVVDPAGVYLKSSALQPRLRILGQQKMKEVGFNIQQNKFEDNLDYLVYKDTRMFKLDTKRGILLLKTNSVDKRERNSESINSTVDRIVSGENLDCCFTF